MTPETTSLLEVSKKKHLIPQGSESKSNKLLSILSVALIMQWLWETKWSPFLLTVQSAVKVIIQSGVLKWTVISIIELRMNNDRGKWAKLWCGISGLCQYSRSFKYSKKLLYARSLQQKCIMEFLGWIFATVLLGWEACKENESLILQKTSIL